jgi:thioesterase domain-containing protein
VHGCAGRVLYLYDLGRFLDPEQPFYGLSPLGFEKGQVPHTQIEDMAAHYIKEIRTIQSNGPYFIGGSGDGCAIVLEMAHQLESQGQDLGLIVLLTPTPLKPAISYTNLTYGRLLRHYFYAYGRLLRHYYRLLIIHLKSRPLIPALYNAFSNRVLWHFRIFHRFIPIEIHRWRRFIEVFSKALMSYEPEAYQGRITCLLRDEFSHNPEKGIGDWSDIAVGGLDVRFVPGNIFTMWKQPHVQVLADQLQVCLDEALTDIGVQRKQSTPTDAADAEIGQNALATPRVSNQ